MDEDISQLSCFCQPPVFQHMIYLVLGHRLFPLVHGQTDGPRSQQWEEGKSIPSLCQGPCGIANKMILLLLNPARSLSPVSVHGGQSCVVEPHQALSPGTAVGHGLVLRASWCWECFGQDFYIWVLKGRAPSFKWPQPETPKWPLEPFGGCKCSQS